MTLGIYAGETTPLAGGAHTLIETIKAEIASSNCPHDIVVFFSDSTSAAEIRVGRVLNVNTHKRNRGSLVVRAKRKLPRLIGSSARADWFDGLLRDCRIDLLWILGPYNREVSVPYIFTVWDLAHRVLPFFPEFRSAGWTWEARENTYQKMLYKASYIVTGNEAGKREILENYPVHPGKICVVPFPVPRTCYEARSLPPSIDGIHEPFVFYPAQFWAHKNHVVLVNALRYLRDEKGVRVNCYFAGSDSGNQHHVQMRINETGMGDQIRILGFVDDTTLRFLYEKALAMTFVSLLGPNNLPPLEAAALGCPVVLSDLEGHREQMGDAALFVNPTDTQAVGNAILRILSDAQLRNELIERGKDLAEHLRRSSYFGEILKVIDAFSSLRACWA